MSGIVCLFGRGNGVRSEDFTRMLEEISHRGPDGSGTWEDGDVGVGHQQLRTTPESAYDEQPIYRDGAVIVADARIDNRRELLDELSLTTPPGHVPDSELLLAAYREWGERCVSRLLGAFAFVIWDVDRRTLFCARDHFGVKPLYYHLDEGLFAAASEPKAILSLPSVSDSIERIAVGDFLMHRFEDQENSYFESINRLPPANVLTVTERETERRQYWELDPTRTITLDSDQAYEQRFRELFEQAVRSRLRASGRIGADLSGGLDSTAVTVMARDRLPETEPLHTFSSVFDDTPESDERAFIEAVTEREGLHSHLIPSDQSGALPDVDEVRKFFDHPPHDTTHFAKWERLKRISEADVGVQLTGELGDNAVGLGLGFLPELLRKGRVFRLYRELQAVGEVVGASTRELFVRNALNPLLPSSLGRISDNLQRGPLRVGDTNPTLSEQFVENYDLQGRLRSFDRDGSFFEHSSRQQQYRSLSSGRVTATLETINMMSAIFGIEPRHPFTDVRLVEFTLAIPPTQQLSDGYTRSILRRSLGDLLPEKIQWRPWKAMLGTALWTALEEEEQTLKEILENPGPLAEYLDFESVRTSHERFIKNQSGEDGRALWKALSLSVWLDEHG